MQDIIVECCANSVSSALIGIKAGANRIELCKNLRNGGETPDRKDIIKLRKLTDKKIHVLVLPKANSFIHSAKEIEKIIDDINFCKKNKIDGVVIGPLKNKYSVSEDLTKKLIKVARPMKVTFHRSFDSLNEIEKNIDQIISSKCDYLLTSGQKSNVNLGLKNIEKIIKLVNDDIKIIAGGGVNLNNIEKLYKIGVRQFHLSGTTKKENEKLETNFKIIKQVVDKLIELKKQDPL